MNISNEDVEAALKAYFGPKMYSVVMGVDLPKRAMRAALETLALPELPWRVRDLQRGLILFRTSSNAHDSINYEALTLKITALSQGDREELVACLRAAALSIESSPAGREG